MAMVNSYALFIALKCVVVILMEIAIMHCSLHCCTSKSLYIMHYCDKLTEFNVVIVIG
jgi:hypothetical protein